jgi:hypothetical protein
MVHVDSATQRPRLLTSYSKRKRRSSRTHWSFQSAKEVADKKKKREVALMALANSQIGGNRKRARGRGERWNRGGDGVFLPSAKQMVGRARREDHRPDLFIGQLGRCPDNKIFAQLFLSTMCVPG